MTPERLAEIREQVADAVAMLDVDPWDASIDVISARALLAHVDHLTAENARLERVVEDYENTIPLALRGGLAEHTDECVVCNHAVYGQMLNITYLED